MYFSSYRTAHAQRMSRAHTNTNGRFEIVVQRKFVRPKSWTLYGVSLSFFRLSKSFVHIYCILNWQEYTFCFNVQRCLFDFSCKILNVLFEFKPIISFNPYMELSKQKAGEMSSAREKELEVEVWNPVWNLKRLFSKPMCIFRSCLHRSWR